MERNSQVGKVKRQASSKHATRVAQLIFQKYSKPDKDETQSETKSSNEEALVRHASRTAWATIVIAAASLLTFGAAVLQYLISSSQLGEMKSGGEGTHTLAQSTKESYVADNRAFVGPTDAMLLPLKVGESIKGSIAYKNTGRQPVALGIETHDAVADKLQIAMTVHPAIEKNRLDCMKAENETTTFASPTTGFSQYNFSFDTQEGTPPIFADQEIVDGKKQIFVFECATYRTIDLVRHTAFCHYYRAQCRHVSSRCLQRWVGCRLSKAPPARPARTRRAPTMVPPVASWWRRTADRGEVNHGRPVPVIRQGNDERRHEQILLQTPQKNFPKFDCTAESHATIESLRL